MTMDPRIGMWLSAICAVLIFVAGSTAALTDLFDPITAKKIVAASAFAGGIVSAVNAVLHAIPSVAGAKTEFPLGPK